MIASMLLSFASCGLLSGEKKTKEDMIAYVGEDVAASFGMDTWVECEKRDVRSPAIYSDYSEDVQFSIYEGYAEIVFTYDYCTLYFSIPDDTVTLIKDEMKRREEAAELFDKRYVIDAASIISEEESVKVLFQNYTKTDIVEVSGERLAGILDHENFTKCRKPNDNLSRVVLIDVGNKYTLEFYAEGYASIVPTDTFIEYRDRAAHYFEASFALMALMNLAD